MTDYERVQVALKAAPKVWLVTGAAGFIGSHLLEKLLLLNQEIVGLDNFATGKQVNLDQLQAAVSPEQWARFRFLKGDIADPEACAKACVGVDFVLHQAALGSVPRSLEDPLGTHRANVTGFLNILAAARAARVKRFVYASSSAVYGDSAQLPKTEDNIGRPLSPYAATKAMNELYAGVFGRCYGLPSIGLRYFNVFGPRQDPEGPYAAVIPKWIAALLHKTPVQINGDGQTSRDFCFVSNVVQANLLAAATERPEAANQVYNVALGERTTLDQLFGLINGALRKLDPALPDQKPVYRDFRPGDVRHSLADIAKAQRLLGYAPAYGIAKGLDLAMGWYLRHLG
jgi:UDP-N-acetylglucosamine 4-epimerase